MDNEARQRRSETAFEILEVCAEAGSQEAIDTILGIIKSEGLWQHYTDDNGRLFSCYSDFLRACEREWGDSTAPASGGTVQNSASTSKPKRITPDERYAARMARLAQK